MKNAHPTRPSALLAALTFCVVACRGDRAGPAAQSGPAASSTAATTSSAGVEESAIVSAVQAWNDALNRHDVEALASLYAERVVLYGNDVPRATALKAKRDALARRKTYAQQIVGAIAVTSGDGAGEFTARFRKRSGPVERERETPAKLSFRLSDGGSPMITEEADDLPVAAATLADAGSECEPTAARVVNAIPAVRKAIEDTKQAVSESKGQSRFGGIGPTYDDEHKLTASLGVFGEQGFEEVVSYTVERGRLSVSIMGAGETVPADALRDVARACR